MNEEQQRLLIDLKRANDRIENQRKVLRETTVKWTEYKRQHDHMATELNRRKWRIRGLEKELEEKSLELSTMAKSYEDLLRSSGQLATQVDELRAEIRKLKKVDR